MRHDGTRRILLPQLILSETCAPGDFGAICRTVVLNGRTTKYSYRPISARPISERDSRTSSYNHVPTVVDGDGAPWEHAAISLLDIIESAGLPANGIDTSQANGTDLADFKRFLDTETIDYLTIPDVKRRRPPYLYRAHLISKVNAREMSRNVARRRMSSVINFYRRLQEREIISSEIEIWETSDKLIEFESHTGGRNFKIVKKTDLSISAPEKSGLLDECIIDGGKLRPLPFEEQAVLLDVLLAGKNTEMTLIILFMLLSAARLQTVLTLPVDKFLDEGCSKLKDVRIPAGPGTGIDTKGDVNRNIHIPGWFYRQLRTYALSDRAAARREKGGRSLDDAYLFLSNRGKPYFESKLDRSTFDDAAEAGQAKKGAAVQAFIRKYLLPTLQEKFGAQFTLRPHDLKATAGLIKWEVLSKAIQLKKLNHNQARNQLREFMWHSSFETTDLYINYKHSREMFFDIQSRFENRLLGLMDMANHDDRSDDDEEEGSNHRRRVRPST
ncbi:integrase [Paraburkholderia ginsengiterrae]|nr:integrase [Paraburkholderia ginsengiterrae]